MKLFSVHDSKAGAYLPPAVFRNAGDAIRACVMQRNNPESLISKFPEDFALFEIGNWDELTGTCETLPTPHHVGKISQLT